VPSCCWFVVLEPVTPVWASYAARGLAASTLYQGTEPAYVAMATLLSFALTLVFDSTAQVPRGQPMHYVASALHVFETALFSWLALNRWVPPMLRERACQIRPGLRWARVGWRHTT
jgi:hypothetical protein